MKNEEWENAKVKLQALGERLLKAGWATEFRIDEKGVSISYTKRGNRRLKTLWRALQELHYEAVEEWDLGFLLALAAKQFKRGRP